LNLDTDSLHSTDTTCTSDSNSFDGHGKSGHRLSESHAPNRRFLQAAAGSLNRHVKMLEAKKQSSTLFGPIRYGKPIPTKTRSKLYHNNPYDTSSTRDDSTANEESEGHDTLQPIQETSLLVSTVPEQEVHRGQSINQLEHKGELPLSVERIEPSDSTNDSFVWFKVNAGDVKELTLNNGVVVFVLRNALKYDKHPDRAT
jgi:hypothetical protein